MVASNQEVFPTVTARAACPLTRRLRIAVSPPTDRSESFHVALDNLDFFLAELTLQAFFETSQKRSRPFSIRCDDAVNHDLVALRDVSHFPESPVGLGEKRESFKPVEQMLL
jgi:hypothetical protein